MAQHNLTDALQHIFEGAAMNLSSMGTLHRNLLNLNYLNYLFRVFQIIRLITLLIHSENHPNILKFTLVLQIKRGKVLVQLLPLKILVPVNLLNLAKR